MRDTTYMKEEQYKEILDVVKKYKDICIYDTDEMESKANKHLFGIELKEKYGLNINPRDIHSLEYIRFGEYKAIGWWGEKYRRTVSWSDDGNQPKDELLFVIGFSTGAYIFGDDYPEEIFKEFWEELKKYQPKYCDTVNHNMYFSIQSASKIFNDFDSLLTKFREIYRDQAKARKIKKMKEELEKLES